MREASEDAAPVAVRPELLQERSRLHAELSLLVTKGVTLSNRRAIQVRCELELHSVAPVTPESFQLRAETLIEELMSIEVRDDEISDSSIAGDAGSGAITIELLVFTEDPLHAIMKALTTIRAAIHAAGDATPGWPEAGDVARTVDAASVQTAWTLIPA
jgi:hypothetical protein